jgi:hypothetical protein
LWDVEVNVVCVPEDPDEYDEDEDDDDEDDIPCI